MNDASEQIWFSIEIAAEPEASEAIEFAFNEMGSLGTSINHLKKSASDVVTVIGYFEALPDDEWLQDELHYALRVHGASEDAIKNVTRQTVENADWLHEWKKHWKPTVIGKFVIAPSWETVADTNKIAIRIEPNMAFGTGTHETTQLCVSAIEKNYRAGMSFLDVGTGTGILAIAAAKLFNAEIAKIAVKKKNKGSATVSAEKTSAASAIFAFKILACDTDVDSISIARENAESNGVGSQIDFYIGSIADETPVYDFVSANLTIDVILPILPLLLKKARKTLVLSGILIEQEETIVSALVDQGVKNLEIERLGEWIAVTIA